MIDNTDYSLFTKTSHDEIAQWDKNRIIQSLKNEIELNINIAQKIANNVENLIKNNKIKIVTTTLIRELINSELINNGLINERNKYCRLGLPISDIKNLMTQKNRENANIPYCPESTNLIIAGSIKKEFALTEIFPKIVSEAHLKGDIHLHDLDYIDRIYCGGQNLEYIKKFGLNLPNNLSIAKPAKHPEVLIAHLIKFSAALQGHFAGAIGWDAVNTFISPYLINLNYKEIKQLAQILIFEFSQQAVARGGQTIFSDLNLYWEVPDHFKLINAIGPGGKYMDYPYGAYKEEAQKFIKAIFEICLEGDGSGRPFAFPKINLHITDKFFNTHGNIEFLELASELASKMGNTYFIFDRSGKIKISQCCRLKIAISKFDIQEASEPWKMRFNALQNVSLNLPRIIYEAKGNFEKILNFIDKRMDIIAKAHICKKKFIQNLLDKKQDGPLALLAMNLDGESFLKFSKSSYLIGMVGLNEMVQAYCGKQLHESKDAFLNGLKIISYIYNKAEDLKKQYNMNFVLEQTPAESTAYRFANLDYKKFSQSENYIKGNFDNNEIYYTNSTQFNVNSDISPIKRVEDEGKFHPLIKAGSITHIWLGEYRPDKKAIASFIKKIFENTTNDQVCFSPEFTCCNSCFKTSRGLSVKCSFCGSKNVDGITRITGYYSKISGWNSGKIGELKNRKKWNI